MTANASQAKPLDHRIDRCVDTDFFLACFNAYVLTVPLFVAPFWPDLVAAKNYIFNCRRCQ
jgi:hypothetical protein